MTRVLQIIEHSQEIDKECKYLFIMKQSRSKQVSVWRSWIIVVSLSNCS
jgi:hypothetical protein